MTLIQLRCASHRSGRFTARHAGVRLRLTLSATAAMGKLPIPSSPAMLCPVSCVMSKTEAMPSPRPPMTSNHTPTFSPLVWTGDHSATAKAQELTPQARNSSESTQPYRPSAYSLTIRKDGSNSGLNTCRLASSRRVVAAVMSARRAAGSEILSAPLFDLTLFIVTVVVTLVLLSSCAAGASALPFTSDVGASDSYRTSPRHELIDLSPWSHLDHWVTKSRPVAARIGHLHALRAARERPEDHRMEV